MMLWLEPRLSVPDKYERKTCMGSRLMMLQLPTSIPASAVTHHGFNCLLVVNTSKMKIACTDAKKLQGADSLLMETKMKRSDREYMGDYSKPATEKMIGTACFMGKNHCCR